METLRDEARRRFGFLRRAEEPTVGSPGRTALAQDKVGPVAEAFAEEVSMKEALDEERRELVFKSQAIQRQIAEQFGVVAGLYREWHGINDQIVIVAVKQHPNDFGARSGALDGPGGAVLQGLADDDRRILARLAASFGGLPVRR